MKTRKIAGIGMMVALAFVLSYIEVLIPISVGIPGVKLGLSNIVVLFSLYQFGPITAIGISLVRILLCGLTFGSIYSMLYSLAGGILSFLVMFLLKKVDKFSIYGVSVAGGVSHNIGQIIVAALVLQTKLILYYVPFLMVIGCITGTGIGVAGGLLYQRLHRQITDLFEE